MKKIMKKQCKKIPSWGCKVFLSVALSSLAVVAHAQNADVCYGIPYTIASAVDASGATAYRWLENGKLISGSAATFLVPANKAVGNYTYIRQAKSEDCDEWQSSNEFVVTVFNCTFSAGTATGATATFTDPRDGKKYKTVVMPDGKTWFAQNLNYTKDLTYNAYAYEANGKPFTSTNNGALAIGSYWCPPRYVGTPVASGDEAACNVYGALYTWETALMVDGKYADDTKSSTAWDESWVTFLYYTGAPSLVSAADINAGRGGTDAKGGGRGICPKGWHMPTEREWAFMLDAINGTDIYGEQTGSAYLGTDQGIQLKSSNTLPAPNADSAAINNGAWILYPTAGNDKTGFCALAAGRRAAEGTLMYRGDVGGWWTACTRNSGSAYAYYLMSHSAQVGRKMPIRSEGHSVRCLLN